MYATADLYDRYRQDAINTSSPVDLVIMLYDGCIKQIRRGKLFDEEKDVAQSNVALGKARDILTFLAESLDLNYNVSDDLLKLYEFMINEMIQAMLSRDLSRCDDVIEMLIDLRDAWVQVKALQPSGYVGDQREL